MKLFHLHCCLSLMWDSGDARTGNRKTMPTNNVIITVMAKILYPKEMVRNVANIKNVANQLGKSEVGML